MRSNLTTSSQQQINKQHRSKHSQPRSVKTNHKQLFLQPHLNSSQPQLNPSQYSSNQKVSSNSNFNNFNGSTQFAQHPPELVNGGIIFFN